jgi:hypothetical protein
VGGTGGRSLFLAALAGCAWLSLRPDARVEGWLDVALAPTRVVAELSAPLRWIRARSVSAAEQRLDERADADYAQRRALYASERQAALPTDPALSFARRFVHVEVVGRRQGHFDQLEVRVDGDSCRGLARGMPVCHGNVFVGRIVELDAPRTGRAWVELVTAREFAVGARVEADAVHPEVRCVVGGLAEVSRASEGRLYLAVSTPSARTLGAASARVDESLSPLARFPTEAQGFLLGQPQPDGEGEWVLRPFVDFRSGLFELVVAAPADIDRPVDVPLSDELFDGRWAEARVTSSGEPSAGREGFELALGRWQGALDGAALVRGARLVGRVVHAGVLACDAQGLGDRGFAVPVLAMVEGARAPLVLGEFVALGRERDEVLFQWDAPLGITAQPGVERLRATLFTGSGATLVPRGLLLGEAWLPVGPGPHRVRLEVDPGIELQGEVWLRLGPDEERAP